MDVKRIALIGVLVVLAFFIFTRLMGSGQEPEPVSEPVRTVVEKVDYTSVLTVAGVLTRGEVVRRDDLVWMDWPTEALTPALITEDANSKNGDGQTLADTLVGAIVKDIVNPGEPVTLSRFIRSGDAGIMAALLRPGMRAVTVRISVDTASGGFIQPGDKVDVILRKSMSSNGQSNVVASTIFEDVQVLAIDQSFRNTAENGAAIPGSTATLELSLPDSESLVAAQAEGEIALVLRGFSNSNSSAPSRAADGRRRARETPPIGVYRSGQVDTVMVQQR